MTSDLILNGIIIGLSATIPLGPIGVLCIQKTINKGWLFGVISGAGAATADMFYAILAGFGLSFITDFLVEYQMYLRIAAGIVLLIMGYKIFFTNPAKQLRKQSQHKRKGLFGDFISIFLLTFSNPLTVFFFIGAFAAFGGIKGDSGYFPVFTLTTSVFIGAMIWWVFLTFLISLFRKRFKLRNLLWINRIAGILIVIFGILAIVSIFFISEGYVQETIQ
jgi:threonine/homoserine/homoserine lactone efflux protein